MSKPFYITTPIYYVNDEPHIGHAYTTVLADILARYSRLAGHETYFLTGTDEHGLKVQRSAVDRGLTPLEQADELVLRFQETWRDLHIQYDDFIRTTEDRHIQVVQHILNYLWERGDIYRSSYEGWYCVPDERFWTEKDVIDGNCPDCGRLVEKLKEDNYFFRMSDYQEWLIDHIQQNPEFIRPSYRRNEVLGFLRKPLGDLCISRPVRRVNWGIPLPFDQEYVTYVWFDALLNYVTAAGYLTDDERFSRQWPEAIHLIGKDILTTHSVFWPTMLKAAGLPQPKGILAHGWWITDGIKMSKSLGNIIKPLEMAQIYGIDAFRFFLVREMKLGRDANFNEAQLSRCYHADLANDLGNLLHRLLNMTARYHDGIIPEPSQLLEIDRVLQDASLNLIKKVLLEISDLALNQALDDILSVVTHVNTYLEQTSPWKIAKSGDTERTGTILYVAIESLRLISLLLHPIMPERTAEIWHRLAWTPPELLNNGLQWGLIKTGSKIILGEPLFPRLV